MEKQIIVIVDFSGGLDLVFKGKTQIKLSLKDNSQVSNLIQLLANQYANQKKQMFFCNGKIKPGILVLINDVDWQLTEKQNTPLQNGDKISFISTLHGG